MNTFDLTLDLSKRGVIQTVQIRQGDTNGTTIAATITDHGVAVSTSGMTARFQMRLPNGTEYYRKAATLSGNTATVTIDEAQAASAVGRTDVAYFQLLQGSTVVASTESFTFVVLPDALADATVPESYDSAIQDAIDALDDAVAEMPDMVEDVLTAHPEWTTTVQDGSITKAKLATDLARDRERLLYRLDNLLTAQLPEGETATAIDAAKTPVAGLALYGRSTQDGTPTPSAPVPIVSVTGNLYQQTVYAAGSTYTTAGITVAQNADGTCTVSGTATGNAWLWGGGSSAVAGYYVALPAGTYTVCGSHSVAAQKMVGSTVSSLVGQTVGSATFTLTAETLVKAVPIIPSGTTVSGETAWVAVYAGSTAYPYVPYGHAGLWARGRNLVGDLAAIKARGVHGTWSGNTYTDNGVSFAFNEDGSIVANGTSTGLSIIQLAQSGFLLPAGTYHLSGCPAGGGTTTYRLDVERVGASVFANDNGSGATFTLDTETNINVRLRVPSGAALANKVFRPMLRLASTGAEFVPYTSTVTPIDLDGHELRSLPDGTRDKVTVDARGHAVLVQRVGEFTITQDLANAAYSYANLGTYGRAVMWVSSATMPQAAEARNGGGWCTMAPWSASYTADSIHAYATISGGNSVVAVFGTGSTAVEVATKYVGAKLYYPLATPVTHDLGTIDPVPLCGPDLTAQAIPTAPFALTYERELNATLARLESAIAELATN